MPILKAEDVLQNTFEQLEKMLHEVRRQKTVSTEPHRPAKGQRSKPDDRHAAGGSGNEKLK